MSLVCLDDFEKRSEEVVSPWIFDYYRSAVCEGRTAVNNKEAFKRLRLLPKCLRNVSKVDLSTNILGFDLSMPVGISPTAYHKLAHDDGEVATARAAEKAGVLMTLSSYSNRSIPEVAAAAPDLIKFQQIYLFKPRTLTELQIRKAEENGFKALVLTVDSPTFGIMYYRARQNYRPRPQYYSFYHLDPEYDGPKPCPLDPSLTWEDVKWLVGFTKLPVIAKGILRGDDAQKAIEAGCKAVWISNHGGRILDTTPPTIDILPEVVEAVAGKVPIFMDGGVRLGTDVMKALALGADMVFMGRPIPHGLSVAGEEGVEAVLRLIKEELETTMMLCGTPTIKDITRDIVAHEREFNRTF